MKYVKYFMALVAVCILMMPAFSMPEDDGSLTGGQTSEDKQIGSGPVAGQMGQDDQQTCQCQGQKPMMQQNCQNQQTCQCQGQKPMMQQNGQNQQTCQCQDSMKDGKVQGQDSMRDSKFNCQVCPQCGKPMMSQDGQDQQTCQCQGQKAMPAPMKA